MEKKTLEILYWTITILFAAFMLLGAIQELLQVPQWQEIMRMLGYPLYVNYIIGAAKVLGVVALLQIWSPTLREWAYAGFTIDILGAAASAGFVEGLASAAMVVAFLIPLALSYWLWKKGGMA